jgi:phospholipid/cholesterol/gamma-HCH transport system substrate-binding protein
MRLAQPLRESQMGCDTLLFSMEDEPKLEPGRKWRLLAVIVLGLIGLIALLWLPSRTREGGSPLQLKTYLADGKGLENGAEVRIAGIRIGRVSSVRVRPELPKAPVEVLMEIDPGYRNSIPVDSRVRLGRAGLMGVTVVDLDIQFAKGPAAKEGDVLRTD